MRIGEYFVPDYGFLAARFYLLAMEVANIERRNPKIFIDFGKRSIVLDGGAVSCCFAGAVAYDRLFHTPTKHVVFSVPDPDPDPRFDSIAPPEKRLLDAEHWTLPEIGRLEGQDMIRRYLGFQKQWCLLKWAHRNPDCWLNDSGADMFDSPVAYGADADSVSMSVISAHLDRVAHKLAWPSDPFDFVHDSDILYL